MDFIKIRFSDERSAPDSREDEPSQASTRFFEPLFTVYRRLWRPAVDIGESQDHYMILVELAGVRNEDLHLEISNRTVRIHGERLERVRQGMLRYHLAEMTYGYFERTLTLPVPIDQDRVEAVFSEGILEIRIPKASPDAAVRRISIRGR